MFSWEVHNKLPICVNWTFLLGVTAEALRVKTDRKWTICKGVGQYPPNFHAKGTSTPIIFAWMDRRANECPTTLLLTVFTSDVNKATTPTAKAKATTPKAKAKAKAKAQTKAKATYLKAKNTTTFSQHLYQTVNVLRSRPNLQSSVFTQNQSVFHQYHHKTYM